MRVTRRATRTIAVAILGLLLVSAVLTVRGGGTRIVAYFPSTTGLYAHDEVKVMGVKVGSIQSIQPDGDRVRVEMVIGSQPIPADVKAAIVAPSLVSGRFVQLAPAYSDGPKMGDGDTIPLNRTAVPVSFDEVKRELTDLSTALGPREAGGARTAGSLNEAITALDDNLGNGTAHRFKKSIAAMRGAVDQLSSGSDDLFTTVANLNVFVKNLAVNDASARELTANLAGFSDVLDTNKVQLGEAVDDLAAVLKLVGKFVDENSDTAVESIAKLETLSRTLAAKSNSLAGLLGVAPHTINGLYTMMGNQAITARLSMNNFDDLSQFLCGSVLGVGGGATECKSAVSPLLDVLKLRSTPQAQQSATPESQAPAQAELPSLIQGLLSSLTQGKDPS
jgi:phospholipid/cholesterol/gamma-HCH transport system substrate-binding protein